MIINELKLVSRKVWEKRGDEWICYYMVCDGWL